MANNEQSSALTGSILGLDVGDRRVGVALASYAARLASPLTTIDRQQADIWQALSSLIEAHQVSEVVIGLPRGLEGQDTAQTAIVQQFIDDFRAKLSVTVHTIDEALTSRQAEDELKNRGVSYTKGDVDALAATYILSDYLGQV